MSAKNLILLLSAVIMTQLSMAQNHPKHEMRGVWIATVDNIDWPSSKGLDTGTQKKELTGMLDIAKQYNLNTVILQIRPAADAFYNSSLEPWSQWLTGEQGKAPEPYYDPLEFAIEECHSRGLDIHVWLNPYRAVFDTGMLTAPDHVTRRHPEWFLRYGRTVYFDPGLPQTRDYVAGVVSDVVRRYDIDAVHMDDYFYPYRIANVPFPDDSSFRTFSDLPENRRDDWRRNNVDLIIKQLHDSIKSIKPWLEFGISPFGVWRNRDRDPAGSATHAGQTNYDDLFADILKWQEEGWIDYVAPQLYWHIGMEAADYAVLADWWNQNTRGRQLYIGQAPYRIDRKASAKSWRSSGEIIRQIELNRTYANIAGNIFFSAKVLLRNPQRLNEKLLKNLYRFPALPPSNSGISAVMPDPPGNPVLLPQDGQIMLQWEKGKNTKYFVLYRHRKEKQNDSRGPQGIYCVTSSLSMTFPGNCRSKASKYSYSITSVSPTNTESKPVYFLK